MPLTLVPPSEGWLNSERVQMSDLIGHPVLFFFWSIGSSACETALHRLLPELEDPQDRGLVALTIHLPTRTEYQSAALVGQAAEDLGLLLPISLDGSAFGQEYGVDAVPAWLVFDTAGELRSFGLGASAVGGALDAIEEAVRQYESGRAPSPTPGERPWSPPT
jgi:hypothetical protein